jgi:apolipoprotein N-acyltransferase
MGAAMMLGDGALQAQPLTQMRWFAVLFLAPEAAAWWWLRAYAARACVEQGALVLSRGAQRLELAAQEIAAVEAWHVPLPGPGASLRLASGKRWRYGLAHADAAALSKALAAAGGAALQERTPSRAATYAQACLAMRRGLLGHPLVKFVVFSLLLAIPAFRLHQHIAYGSAFGEYYSFGLKAYLTTFLLWWAAWMIGVVLCAAALRAAIEAGTLLMVLVRPARAIDARRWLEHASLVALYLGLPAWLLLRALAR